MLKSLLLVLTLMTGLVATAAEKQAPTLVPVNPTALKACLGLKDKFYDPACLHAIQGKYFSPGSASTCGNIEDDSLRIECLQRVANAYIAKDLSLFCDSAVDGEGYKLSCMIFGVNQSVQKESLQICRRLQSDLARTTCVKAIVGKEFDPKLINFCATRAGYDEIQTCIETLEYRRTGR